MKYQIIFTLGYTDDDYSLMQGLRGDVMILDETGNYYDPYFITIDRIYSEFTDRRICYLWDKIVILHEVTKGNILKSIPEIHKWMFQKRWIPLTEDQIEKYCFPKDDWVIYTINIDESKIE
jgi:hypothetical protein